MIIWSILDCKNYYLIASKICGFPHDVDKIYEVKFVFPLTWSENYIIIESKFITYITKFSYFY